METGKVMPLFKNSSILSAVQKTCAVPFLAIILITTLIMTGVSFLEGFLVVDRPLHYADALVVMAGEMPIRLPAAAELFKEGKAERILLTNDGTFSSWSEDRQRNLYQVEWAEYQLLKRQVPEHAIVKLSYSSSGTIHDALNTRKYVLDKGLKSIIVVTSDYHARRTLWTFERVFRGQPVTIGIYPASSSSVVSSYFNKLKTLGYEMVKYTYYKCRYSFWL